jgi:hypothetical protein
MKSSCSFSSYSLIFASSSHSLQKFTKNQLRSIIIDSTDTLKRFSVKEICEADMVIVPAGIIEERGTTATSRPYTELLSIKAGAQHIPPAPSNGHKEAPTIEGTWVRNMASGPAIYVGNDCRQKHRDEQAFYGHRYSEAITKLRRKSFGASERGIPLEWFTWERIVVDECHECLVSTARQDQESKASEFKSQARRGAREFLGVGCTNKSTRPLLAKTAVWGLTGTPLLETEARVTELANLMGGKSIFLFFQWCIFIPLILFFWTQERISRAVLITGGKKSASPVVISF